VAPDGSPRSGRSGGGRASQRFRVERATTRLAQRLVDEAVAGTPWMPEALGVVRRASADRTYVSPPSQTVILGADAQTTSWAQVLQDFPQLGPGKTAVSQALRMQNGVEPLPAGLFNVPHHGSKRGLNVELVEQIAPAVTLFSCGRDRGKYFVPHTITQEIIREALEPIATKPAATRTADIELGMHYTGSQTDARTSAGSIGVLIAPSGRRQVWRFMDRRDVMVNLDRGRRVL
jgi:hypothetical protein